MLTKLPRQHNAPAGHWLIAQSFEERPVEILRGAGKRLAIT
jgi:hypothetical protein